MTNIRMKIATGATILGLGGLAGYAVSSNGAQDASVSTAAEHLKPKVHTQVIRRTRHVRPHPKSGAAAAGSNPGGSSAAPSSAPASAPAPVMATAPPPSPAPAAAPASPPSNQPVSTHSSGGGGGGYEDDEGEDDGGERGDD